MDTDLTYEDISLENMGKCQYERLPDQLLDDVPICVVRARSGRTGAAMHSACTHRALYVSQAHRVILQIDYHDRRGRLVRQFRARTPPVRVAGQAWRVGHVIVENFQASHTTEIFMQARELGESAAPEMLFEVENLPQAGQVAAAE